MQSLVALIAPVLMALGFYNHLHRNQLSTRKLVFAFGIFSLLVNLCTYLVIILILDQKVAFTDRSFITYLIVAAIFSLVLPFAVNLVENSIEIEVNKNDKN